MLGRQCARRFENQTSQHWRAACTRKTCPLRNHDESEVNFAAEWPQQIQTAIATAAPSVSSYLGLVGGGAESNGDAQRKYEQTRSQDRFSFGSANIHYHHGARRRNNKLLLEIWTNTLARTLFLWKYEQSRPPWIKPPRSRATEMIHFPQYDRACLLKCLLPILEININNDLY